MTWSFLKRCRIRKVARPIHLEFHSGMGFDIPVRTSRPGDPEASPSSCFGKVLVMVDPSCSPARSPASRLVSI